MEILKKTTAAMAICLAVLSASAVVLTQEGFETSRESFVADDSEADYSVVTNYLNDADKPAADPDYPFNVSGYGSKYLSVDTGDTTIRHAFPTSSSSVYFDAMMKFTTSESDDVEYDDDSKFTIYLDSATSNLCAISGTSADNRAVVTNRLDSATIVPGSWGRLTVNALRSNGVFAFQVRVNGELLTASGVDTFYSMTADTTMSEVNFTGCGALENMAVRTTDPYLPAVGAVASVDGRYYASLADAFEESTSDDTVILLANNAEDINLAEGRTFKLKATGVAYSGTVYSYSGYRLETSDPDENGVITYSQVPYKPSISINFTNDADNGLTTSGDVGLSGYEVPGTSWNNFTIPNNAVEQTLGTVNAVDSTGAASVESGVSVTVSNQRGSYRCSLLTAASNPLQSYIDEAADKTTPTVTVSGIPYYRYRVIVYHSTDTENVPFGYDTINGTNYTYVNDALTEGTTAWGNSGAYDNANAMSIGGNVLVTGELSGPTLTVVGHRAGGADNARGCIAAIQIIEIKPEITENDLEIPVSGNTTYTVSEAKTPSGTVYITGNGTLTLGGNAKINAATINVGASVILNVNADRLDGTTFVGAGTVVYDGAVPPTGKGWTESTAWTGTVWIKNKGITGDNNATTAVKPNSLGNSLSKVKFSGVNGWIEAPVEYNPEIVLENAGYDYALQLTNGNSPNTGNPDRATIIKKLSGSGILCCGGTSDAVPTLKVYDASGFTGSINTVNADNAAKTGLAVVFCEEGASLPNTLVNMFINSSMRRSIYIASGKEMTLDAAATWTAETGFIINGTLIANGTLASSHATKAVSGSGTVVFTGRAPTVSGDAWWKNEAWTGTVTVKSVTNLSGDSSGTYIDFNKCGNAGSVIELDAVSGWLNPGYVCNVPLKITGTFSLVNGYSDKANAFKVGTLLGSGTISCSSSAPTAVFNVTTDWSGFTGNIGLNNKCVVFGATIPDTITRGQIYISAGAVVTNNVASGNWWAVGGIKVDGELCAPSLDKFGGGTTITTTDNGVFTLTSTGNGEESETDTSYARITGTGTLKYEGTGWRALSTNNFPTAMTLANEQAGDILLSRALTYTIGSLSGTKNIQGNYGSGARYLRVLQSKDTEWSGKVIADNSDRFKGLTVAPGASAAGTLTLSGTQVKSQTLTVESGAKVNLTGTWIGNVTVAGTFGGTGTVTGNLTLSDGATIKVNDMSDLLTVTGNLTTTAGTTVKIELPAGARKGMKFIDVTGPVDINSGTKFEVYVGGERKRYLSAKALKDGSGVKVTCPPFQVRFLSPSSSAAN